MGLFGSSEPRNSQLVDLLTSTGPDKSSKKHALKVLATLEDHLEEISRTDGLALLAVDTREATHLVAVTLKGVLDLNKRGVDKTFAFPDIAETQIFRHPNGMLVRIETHKYRQDFMEGDYRALPYYIQMFQAVPGAAQQLCGIIDRNL